MTLRQHQLGEVSEPAAGLERQRRREPLDGCAEAANEGYAERRRRSRTTSITIGMNESRITITTTLWM